MFLASSRKAIAVVGIIGLIILSGSVMYQRMQSNDSTSESREMVELSDQPYLRAAHWFGSAWPVNFWNTDLESRASADFEKIIEDGFNTVVLLVPWPGFAPDPHSGELDGERVDRLTRVMQLANEMGLKTVLRISYAWDGLDEKSGSRLANLWVSDHYYQGWLDHIETLWGEVSEIPGFQFAFFSWEDLWAATWFADADAEGRKKAARDMGFAEWIMEEVEPERVNRLLGSGIDGPDDIRLPRRTQPGYKLFLEFMNQAWVSRYFLPAQERFPRLSMEIRIDADAIFDGDERLDWFYHHEAWSLPGAEWVTLYWSPAMGGANQGETLDPAEAASRLEHWLDEVRSHAGPRHIFIGQFLVEDFTPGYELNGRIPRDEVVDFLQLAEPVLQERASGFGLWTWTDYRHDAIANPEFFAGLSGWRHDDGVVLSDSGVDLKEKAWMEFSTLQPNYHAPGGPEIVDLCVLAAASHEDGASLGVYQRRSREYHLIEALEFGLSPSEQCLEYDAQNLTLRLEAESALRIKRVNSIGFVQDSGMREVGFEPKAVAEGYRALNAGIRYRPLLSRERYDDGWMGRFWLERLSVAEDATLFQLDTYLPEGWPESPELTVTLNGQTVGTVACGDEEPHVFELPAAHSSALEVHVEASSTHRPQWDQRNLGCLIVKAEASAP